MNNQADIQFLEDYLQNHPDSLLFARLADAYLQNEKFDQATELCEEGTKKHPYYATGHLILGKCYLAKKQYDQAEKEFKRVLLFDPKYLTAHKLYGDLMQEIGWENTCENSYRKILQIDPLDDVIRSRLGEFTVPADRPEQAVEEEAPVADTPHSDLESVAPLPLSSDEEKMLYEGEKPSVDDRTVDLETPLPEADEADTEKFSSILDDIFKDEVVQEETPSNDSMDIYSSDEDLVSEIQREPEKYFENVKRFEDHVTAEEDEEEPLEIGAPKIENREPAEEKANAKEPEEARPQAQKAPEPPSVKHEMPPAPPRPKPSEAKEEKPRDKIVTPTLGEIYAAQGQYAKAIGVFELLLSKNPDNSEFATKLEQLRHKLAETGNAAKN